MKRKKGFFGALAAVGMALTITVTAPVSALSMKAQAAPASEAGAYSGKYQYATQELMRRMQNNEFRAEVAVEVNNQLSLQMLYRCMQPEEMADMAEMSTLANQQDFLDLCNLMFLRLYDNVEAQMQQGAVALPEQSEELQQLMMLVAATQEHLQALGFYDGGITGMMDEATSQALMNFQAASGLTVDGSINQEIVQVFGLS